MKCSIWYVYSLLVLICMAVPAGCGGNGGGGSQLTATHFSVSAQGNATAGTTFSFTVTALDASNNAVTTYIGTVHFTSSDAQALIPPDSTLSNGTKTFSATLKTTGSQTITATDTVSASVTGTSNSITVSPAVAATHLSVTAPSSTAVGTAFNVTVTALDSSNNTVTTYSGTMHFTSTDSLAVLPPNTTLTNGTKTFSVTLKTGGNQTITATDTVTASITGTSNSISVSGLAAIFTFNVPSSVTTGTAFNLTVTAIDTMGNVVVSYSGTVHFTSSDAQAVLPADSKVTNGVGNFSATLKTVGGQTISATDTANASITGNSGTITVTASTTLYVNGASGSDSNNCLSAQAACLTIGHAISLAASGDNVMVSAATYTEALTVGLNLNLIGAGASTTIIDGRASGAVVTISNTTAHVTLSNLTIRNGKHSPGGGINNSGTLMLTNSTVSGNWAPIPCNPIGLVCISYGTAYGGGIYNSGALTISNSTISGNQAGNYCNANACSAFGGGIYNKGTLVVIESSTLNGNFAHTACSTSLSCHVGQGGALYTIGSTVTLNNSTIAENIAYRCSGTCGGTGGAIVNGSGTFVMDNSTASGNPAGGIVNGGTATLQNSIVDNNAGINCSGTITSLGYNLSSDDTCKLSGPGDLNNQDPMLGPLQNNGGATQTMALPPGSPAIDAGNPSGCTDGQGHLLKTDQRGMPRPDPEDTVGCDIGAYESQSD